MEKMTDDLKALFEKYVPKPTEQVKLKLPKLNMKPQKEGNNTSKIKLPKLKKVE